MKNIFNIKIHLIYGGIVSGYLPNGNFGIAQLAPNKGKGETVTVNGKWWYQKLVKKFDKSITFGKAFGGGL
jgi:K+-transporting ATPase ATPase C chain